MNQTVNNCVFLRLNSLEVSLEVVLFALEVWLGIKDPGKKITMIRIIRSYPGCSLGLKDAKDLVEFVMNEHNSSWLIALKQTQWNVVQT